MPSSLGIHYYFKLFNHLVGPPPPPPPRVEDNEQRGDNGHIGDRNGQTIQSWFPVLLSMLTDHPQEIQPYKLLLTPFDTKVLPSTSQETVPFSSTFIKETLQGLGISAPATDLICHSWRPSTRDQYDSIMLWWGGFCACRHTNTSLFSHSK